MKRDLLVGITGWKKKHWKDKIEEIDYLGMERVTLFLERFELKDRRGIYDALSSSVIREIPLVHIRDDMEKGEIKWLFDNYGSRYFTIHESHFDVMEKWRGFFKYLYLEMNADDRIPNNVDVSRIGGFCVDLSHYMKAKVAAVEDYHYVHSRKGTERYFGCNHLNGYSYELNKDLHTVRSLDEFEYLKELPEFLFGKVIGIETDNPIRDQMRFKEHLMKIFPDLW